MWADMHSANILPSIFVFLFVFHVVPCSPPPPPSYDLIFTYNGNLLESCARYVSAPLIRRMSTRGDLPTSGSLGLEG